jgi:hypothetical protein
MGSSSKYVTQPVQPTLVEGPEHREHMPEYMQPQYVRETDPWQRGPFPLAEGEGRGRPYPENDPEAWQRIVGQRLAMPYHWAPTDKREQIEQQGLVPQVPSASRWDYEFDHGQQPKGVYMFENEPDARYWGWENLGIGQGGKPHDLWEIDDQGLKTRPDEMMAYPSAYSPRKIPPNRLWRVPDEEDEVASNVRDSGYFTGTVNKASGVNNLTEVPSPWGAGCPSCGGPHVDEDSGECTDCGKAIPYDGGEQLMGYDFTPPELLADQPGGFMQWDTSGLEPHHGHRNEAARNISVESNMWDPLTCEYCGGPMSEPKQVPKAWGAGGEWLNHCTRCHRTRAVPNNYPLLRQQQESDPQYPPLLQEVGPERPWVFAAQAPAPSADNQRVSWNPFRYDPKLPTHEELAQGKMCRFHPNRPAVIAVGFAPMCQDCARSFQEAGQRVQAPQWAGLTASERLAETTGGPWEGHAWHTNSLPFSTPARTPYWTTTDEAEAKDAGETVHPVSLRFHQPAHFFGELPDNWQEMTGHNDGIVVHRPGGAWAIALDPGAVTPGHLKNPLE